jgi:hypothetical protein
MTTLLRAPSTLLNPHPGYQDGISYPVQSLRSMRAIVLHTLSLPHLTSYLLACAT